MNQEVLEYMSSNLGKMDKMHLHDTLTLSQTTNYRLSKLKDFAEDNFIFDENGRKSSKRIENSGKRINCSLPTCTADKLKPGLVCERVN